MFKILNAPASSEVKTISPQFIPAHMFTSEDFIIGGLRETSDKELVMLMGFANPSYKDGQKMVGIVIDTPATAELLSGKLADLAAMWTVATAQKKLEEVSSEEAAIDSREILTAPGV